jgi:hypothetical protein
VGNYSGNSVFGNVKGPYALKDKGEFQFGTHHILIYGGRMGNTILIKHGAGAPTSE